MQKKNCLIIAAAGSGKTTLLVEMALANPNASILITTYTEANEAEIRKKFVEKRGCVPSHVWIQTWFSFLIYHGVKPFQGGFLDQEIKGLDLVNTMSTKGVPENNKQKYYLNKNCKVYSDKLSKLAVRCNEFSCGMVTDRLSRIYSHIYVDEVQDLAGYDLDFLKLLFGTTIKVVLVGDPRQVTYLTHHENRYGKYKQGKIKNFVQNECGQLNVEIDEYTLQGSFRNNEMICNIADQLYPEFNPTISRQERKSTHDGVFIVNTIDKDKYLDYFKPVQLRNNISKVVSSKCPVHNFGAAKGLDFDRVLIYPTVEMVKWISNRHTVLKEETKAKFYVALTRARYSAAIICDLHGQPHDGIPEWP